MARKKQPSQTYEITGTKNPFTPTKIKSSTKIPNPVIPTGDKKHATRIREGRVSFEIFCKNPERRRQLGLTPHTSYASDLIGELRAPDFIQELRS